MRWSRWAVCLLALLCMCILICSAALADWQIEMNPVEWTWDANGVASFSGVIRTDGADVSGAVLSLAVDTRMEDSGEVLFTALNEKKVKLRKRSNTAEIDISGANAENTFEGEWYLPAEVEEGLASAVVHLSIADGEGKELAKYDMQDPRKRTPLLRLIPRQRSWTGCSIFCFSEELVSGFWHLAVMLFCSANVRTRTDPSSYEWNVLAGWRIKCRFITV